MTRGASPPNHTWAGYKTPRYEMTKWKSAKESSLVDSGVVYVDGPEDVLGKRGELVRNGTVESFGLKARSFVERNCWDTISDEFERIPEKAIEEKSKV